MSASCRRSTLLQIFLRLSVASGWAHCRALAAARMAGLSHKVRHKLTRRGLRWWLVQYHQLESRAVFRFFSDESSWIALLSMRQRWPELSFRSTPSYLHTVERHKQKAVL